MGTTCSHSLRAHTRSKRQIGGATDYCPGRSKIITQIFPFDERSEGSSQVHRSFRRSNNAHAGAGVCKFLSEGVRRLSVRSPRKSGYWRDSGFGSTHRGAMSEAPTYRNSKWGHTEYPSVVLEVVDSDTSGAMARSRPAPFRQLVLADPCVRLRHETRSVDIDPFSESHRRLFVQVLSPGGSLEARRSISRISWTPFGISDRSVMKKCAPEIR